jgi:uncharacterized protein (TIGR02453 family)
VTSPPPSSTAFTGFPPDALGFLTALALHQSRDWFQAHRATFEATLRQPMGALVDAVSVELARRHVPLQGHGVAAVFRMNRDLRFSKDKRPYRTNVGAMLTRDGVKGGLGVLYLHLDPAGSFVAAGVYQAEPAELKRIRSRIVSQGRAFRAIQARLKKARLKLDPMGALKRLPRGFEAVEAEDLQAALRLRHFIVRRDLPEAALTRGKGLVATVAGLAEAALPLLQFCWAATAGAP